MFGLKFSELNVRFIFTFAFILQLLTFATFDLGVDEAHYMLYARHLALSYFDHPPLVGWTHWLFNFMLGENLFSARLPAMLIGVFSTWQLYLFLKDSFLENTAKIAALAMGFCLQFFVLHLFFLPETLCILFLWPLMRATTSVANKNDTASWLWLGLLLGLMGLSKYTGVFFLVPVAAVILPRQKLSVFKAPGFYLAIILAAVIISPVVIWNHQNDWISFKYQSGHVLGGSKGFKNVFRAFAAQFGLYGPFLWPFSLIGFYDLFKRKTPNARFALWTAFTFAAFFIYSSWTSVLLPHWPAIFYLFALPWGFAVVFEKSQKWADVPLALNMGLIVLVCVLLLTGLGFKIPLAFRDVTGWPEFMSSTLPELQPNEALVFTNWTYGSRALYYGRDFESKIFVVNDQPDQFDLWQTEKPWSKNLWVVSFSYDKKNILDKFKCDSVGPEVIFPVTFRGYHQYDFIKQLCLNAQKK